MKKERLDVLLVNRGLAESREKAKRTIMAGLVTVGGRVEDKPGSVFDTESEIAVTGRECPYVSRGGLKLEKAIEDWGVDCRGKVCMDMGASTGGFTDCMLQHGAARVMAIDVGTNQLAYRLRTDPRVWVRENFNARNLTIADLPERPSRAVTDVSFISLKLILPPMADVLLPGGEMVSLVKPQFEAGRGQAPGGVVSDPAVRQRVLEDITAFGEQTLGLTLLGTAESPIRGREKGNVEYLAHWRKSCTPNRNVVN